MSKPSILDDEATFTSAAQRHRRELHVHCYRMLGSFDDAEDAVRETFLRGWKIVTFPAEVFGHFGLPEELDGEGRIP